MNYYYPGKKQTPLPTVAKNPFDDNVTGTFVIPIESHLEGKIKFNLDDVPPFRGQASPAKWTDEIRQADYELRCQLRRPGTNLEQVLPRDISHVRTHAEAERALRPIIAAANAAKVPLIVGLDAEDGGTTVQIASRINDKQHIVVLQTRSSLRPSEEMPITNVKAEGMPKAVIEVLSHHNVIFAGTDFVKDLKDIVNSFGLNDDAAERIRYIDTALQYAFISNFARGPVHLRVFMGSSHERKNRGVLGPTSLKFQYEFVRENRVVDKNPRHKNHRADFAEKNGRLPNSLLTYAGLDALLSYDVAVLMAEMLGVRPSLFAQTCDDNDNYDDVNFSEMVRFLCDMQDIQVGNLPPGKSPEGLTTLQMDEVTGMFAKWDVIRDRVAEAESNEVRMRRERQIVMANLANVWKKEKKKRNIELRVYVPDDHLFLRPPPSNSACTAAEPSLGDRRGNDDNSSTSTNNK